MIVSGKKKQKEKPEKRKKNKKGLLYRPPGRGLSRLSR
jgi:hypothetical protein